MSEPKRYTDLQVWEALHFAGSTNGWVRWEDYARLKAEVERIRKAGDAIYENQLEVMQIFGLEVEDCFFMMAWNAAKEGKQP